VSRGVTIGFVGPGITLEGLMEPFESIVVGLVFFFFKAKKKKNEVSV